jgi:hypothetical protein
METITRTVAELDPQDRLLFERMTGRPLMGSETLQIEIVDSGPPVRQPRPRPPVTGVPKAGGYAGRLIVPDDFDEPLDELREYME